MDERSQGEEVRSLSPPCYEQSGVRGHVTPGCMQGRQSCHKNCQLVKPETKFNTQIWLGKLFLKQCLAPLYVKLDQLGIQTDRTDRTESTIRE